jgi:hypothetical protein
MNARLVHPIKVFTFYVLLFTFFFSPVLFSGRILAFSDSLALYLPAFFSPVSLWEPNLQGGFPVAADLQNATWYPIARLFALFGFWNGFVIRAYVLIGCFSYAYTYFLTKSWVGAAVSGIVAGMCGFSMAHLCHTIILHGMAWIPLVLLSIAKLRTEGGRIWFVIGSGAIAFSLLAGHPQIPTYGLIVAGIYALTLASGSSHPFRFLAICFAMFLAGVSFTAIQLVPLFELVSQSIREKPDFHFFQSISLKPLNLTTFIFPAVFGTPDTSFYQYRYFGAINFIERTFYPGLAALLLSFVGIQCFKEKRVVWFWLFVLIISLLFSLGDTLPFARVLFLVPGLNNFRVPARHVFEMTLAITVLAGLGAAAIHQRYATQKNILLSVIPGTIIFLIAAAAIRLNANTIQAMGLKNGITSLTLAPWINSAIATPIILFVIASVVLFFYANKPTTSRALIMIGFVFLDLASIGFFCEWKLSPEKSVLLLPETLKEIREELNETDQRFLPVRGVWSTVDEGRPNLTRLWSIPSGSGYGSLILKRVNELLSMSLQGSVSGNWMSSSNKSLDLMSVRYISARTQDPVIKRWQFVRQDGSSVILENRHAMPRAWLVPKVIEASSEEIRNTIISVGSRYKPYEFAFVENHFAFESTKDPQAKVEIRKIEKSSMEIQVETANPAFLVVSDVYYPGWTAKVNNTSTQIYRTNYLFRGILVPSGSSMVRMEFRPTSFQLGLLITIGSFLIVAVVMMKIKIPAE